MSFKHHQIIDEHEISVVMIQHWFKDQFKTNKQLLKLKSHSTEIDLLMKTIDTITKSTSIDDVHGYLSSNGFTAGAMFILKALFPQSTHGTIKNSARHTHLLRILTSSFMISKFPEQVLYAQDENDDNISNTESSTTAMHLERETQACLFDARCVYNTLPKLILSINKKFQKFNANIHQFSLSLRLFNKSFDAWRKADSERLISSLGVTFGQTYSVYIGATNGLVDNSIYNASEPTGPELIIATQLQLDKIRTAMVRVMGKEAAVNRIEEICAAVEAAFYSAATTTANNTATTTANTTQQLSQEENINHKTTTATQSSQPVTSPAPHGHPTHSMIERSPSNKTATQQATVLPQQSFSTADLSIPPAATTNTATEIDTLTTPQLKVLDKLAQLAGIAQERLAYEMVLNPYYRLPPLTNPLTVAMEASALRRSTSNTSVQSASAGSDHGESSPRSQQTLSSAVSLQDTSSIVQVLKTQMLRVMGDKLVNSLRQSSVTSIDQITEGMMVPVYLMPNNHQPELYTAGTGHTTISYTRTPILTAKVLAIHKLINDDKEDGDIYYDVEYTSDHTLENSVISSRIVLKNHVISDPTPLLLALQDLGNQIAALTPNRQDIQQEILSTIDVPLLSQMIVNRALNPVNDLLPILQYFQRSLQALQAPSRTAITDAWIRDLSESFYKVEMTTSSTNNTITSSAEKASVPSSGQRRGRSLDEVAPLLPVFFERATAVIEEIQRDMANYYISVLVPVLQQPQGIEYLKTKFQMRVQTGQTSLDAAASLLYAQLMPAAQFQNTIKDLTEAGACAEGGFSLSDILPSALGSAPSPPTPTSERASTTPSNPTNSAAPVLPASPAAVGTRRNLVDCIVAHSIIELMQLPVRLDSREAAHLLPETLVWDASRLAVMRDLVDRIALECSLVIACKQVMARYQLPAWCSEPSAEVELQHRLDVLLTENDTSMASITAEVVRYIKEAIQKFRHAQFSSQSTTNSNNSGSRNTGSTSTTTTTTTHPALVGGDIEEITERVSKGLKDVVAHGNPVLTLFSKRIYKVLLRAMLGQGYKHLLPAYSLHSTAQQRNLTQLLQSTTRLFHHTMSINREIYTVIIGRAVATATDTTATTATMSSSGTTAS